MIISSAFAQEVAAQAPAAAGVDLKGFVTFALILWVFYWFVLRPQQKRIKQHEMELKAIVKGVKIVVGSMEATVTKVIDDEKVEAEIAPGVRVTVIRNYISQVLLPQTEKKK